MQVEPLTPEEVQYQWEQRRCAAMTSMIITGISVILLAASLGYPQLMYAENTYFGIKLYARLGYFGAEMCVVDGNCSPSLTTADLNCGSDSTQSGAMVLTIIAMISLGVTACLGIFELCNQIMLPIATVVFSSIAIGATVLAHILLFVVRGKGLVGCHVADGGEHFA